MSARSNNAVPASISHVAPGSQIRLPPVLPKYPAICAEGVPLICEFLADAAKHDIQTAHMAHVAQIAQFAHAQMAQMAQKAQMAQMAQMAVAGGVAGMELFTQQKIDQSQVPLPSLSNVMLSRRSPYAAGNETSLKRSQPDHSPTAQRPKKRMAVAQRNHGRQPKPSRLQAVTQAKVQRSKRSLCEDCNLTVPSYGNPVDGKMRWCAGCAWKNHKVAQRLTKDTLCEDCKLKVPSYGLKTDVRRRWCAGCAKNHLNVDKKTKRPTCEDCMGTVPSYGIPTEGKLRWCSSCAKTSHPQAKRLAKDTMCEDCKCKAPSYGLATQSRRRWCARCARANHPNAVAMIKPRSCEDCLSKIPSYGTRKNGRLTRRWCAGCAKANHPGSESWHKEQALNKATNKSEAGLRP